MEDILIEVNNDMVVLQLHLANLRKLSGWTSEELALKFDVTKQNISRLENLANKINRFQYISLRTIFEHKAKDSLYLKNCLLLLFYNPNYKKDRRIIDSTIKELANAVYNNMERSINLIYENVIEPLIKPLLVDDVTKIPADKWVEKIISHKKEK